MKVGDPRQVWTGGLPHLPGVPHLHVNRPPKLELACTFSRLLLLFEFLYYYETDSQGLSFTSLETEQTKQRGPGTFIWLKQIHLKHLLYTNLNLILANLIHQK